MELLCADERDFEGDGDDGEEQTPSNGRQERSATFERTQLGTIRSSIITATKVLTKRLFPTFMYESIPEY